MLLGNPGNIDVDRITELRRQMQAMETLPPPAPWKKVVAHATDGSMFGFAEKSDLLLTVSVDGREVFDCLSGQSIVRQEQDLAWYHMSAFEGIGPLAGQIVRLAGWHGGGLSTITGDGWRLHAVAPTWPDYRVILFPPEALSFKDHGLAGCVQVEQMQHVLTYGFSPTARSFIVAQQHMLHIYARPSAPGFLHQV